MSKSWGGNVLRVSDTQPYFTHNLICEFELLDVNLRCFVVRQLLWCIYALSSVNFQASNCGCVKKVTNMKYACLLYDQISEQSSKCPFRCEVAHPDRAKISFFSYRLHKLVMGYLAPGYIARDFWLYSHWLYSQKSLAI